VRTLLQCFRTKIFLSTTDHATARFASELCGEHEVLRPSYTITENGQETHVSTLTGRAGAPASNVSVATTYALQKQPRFEPSAFYNLKNAQAIVLAFDGVNPLPSTYCFLKPAHLDANLSYFEQAERGLL
jgi:type IV secretory pathway TraG/TraD family ATPase VirD4